MCAVHPVPAQIVGGGAIVMEPVVPRSATMESIWTYPVEVPPVMVEWDRFFVHLAQALLSVYELLHFQAVLFGQILALPILALAELVGLQPARRV